MAHITGTDPSPREKALRLLATAATHAASARGEAAALFRVGQPAFYCAGRGEPVARCASLAQWDAAVAAGRALILAPRAAGPLGGEHAPRGTAHPRAD